MAREFAYLFYQVCRAKASPAIHRKPLTFLCIFHLNLTWLKLKNHTNVHTCSAILEFSKNDNIVIQMKIEYRQMNKM